MVSIKKFCYFAAASAIFLSGGCTSRANLYTKIEAGTYNPKALSSARMKGAEHKFGSLGANLCSPKLWTCISSSFIYSQGTFDENDSTDNARYNRNFAGSQFGLELVPQGGWLDALNFVILPMLRFSTAPGALDQTRSPGLDLDRSSRQSGYAVLSRIEGGLYVKLLNLGLAVTAGQGQTYERLSRSTVDSAGPTLSISLLFLMTQIGGGPQSGASLGVQ